MKESYTQLRTNGLRYNPLISLSQSNSFQAVLVTDGTTSYCIFIYHCDLLLSSGAAIGFSASGNFSFNHRLSLQTHSNEVACSNRPDSDWNALIYVINYDGRKNYNFNARGKHVSKKWLKSHDWYLIYSRKLVF